MFCGWIRPSLCDSWNHFVIRPYKKIEKQGQYYFFFTYNIDIICAKWQSNTEVICVHTLTFIPITIHRTYFNSLITGMICNKYVNIL